MGIYQFLILLLLFFDSNCQSFNYNQTFEINTLGLSENEYIFQVFLDISEILDNELIHQDCLDVAFYDPSNSNFLEHWIIECGANSTILLKKSVQLGKNYIVIVYGDSTASEEPPGRLSFSGKFVVPSLANCKSSMPGWDSFDNLNLNKLIPRGSGSYTDSSSKDGGHDESTTHEHPIFAYYSTCSSSIKIHTGTSDQLLASPDIHDHEYTGIQHIPGGMPPVEYYPKTFNAMFCESSSLNFEYGLLGMFTSSPENSEIWEDQTTINESGGYPRGRNTGTNLGEIISGLGQDGHSLSFDSKNDASSYYWINDMYGSDFCAGSYHHHSISGETGNHEDVHPPYYTVMFNKFISTSPRNVFDENLLLMATSLPPFFEQFGDMDAAFPRAGSGPGNTGGEECHVHNLAGILSVGQSSLTTDECTYYSSGMYTTAAGDHTHTITGGSNDYCTPESANLPEYKNILFVKLGGDFNPVVSEAKIIDPTSSDPTQDDNDDDDSTPDDDNNDDSQNDDDNDNDDGSGNNSSKKAGAVVAAILVPFLVIGLLCLAGFGVAGVVVVVLMRRKIQKSEREKYKSLQTELMPDETNVNIAQLKINKKLFEIEYSDLELKAILGKGGSGASVFKCEYFGKTCAFKCFDTRLIFADQHNFDAFEKEVAILGSVSHENILQFLGACIHPPRVGILMEFAPHGDMYEFIKKNPDTTIEERVRFLQEIVSAFVFLHSKNVMHRDLKAENVLITKNNIAKLTDFGLAKAIEKMSQNQTQLIGTPIYMYATMTGIFEPFGNVANVQIKVANDKSFRPLISTNENEDEFLPDWAADICRKSWVDDPSSRLTFQEIFKKLQK